MPTDIHSDLGFSREPTIHLPPLYLRVAKKRKNFFLHKFQDDALKSEACVNFIHCPVGSGKTYAFMLASCPKILDSRVLMVLPTNALIEDVRDEASSILGEGEVVSITAGDLDIAQREGGKKRHEALEELLGRGSFVITNPDILSYMLHGAYGHYTETFDWLRALTSGFGFDLIVFDEYHLFEEDEFAVILPFISLMQAEGIGPPKFFLLSGTPQEAYIEEVKRIYGNGSCRVGTIEESPTHTPIEGNDARLIQKEKIVYLSNNRKGQSLFDLLTQGELVKNSVVDYIEEKSPVLFIFDSISDAIRFDDLLLEHYSEEEIGRNTGIETRIVGEERPFSIERAKRRGYKAIITTSKIEVGVNYPVDSAIMESGPRVENAIQRVGRVGRGSEGRKSAEIFLLASRISKDRFKLRKALESYTKGVVPSGRRIGTYYLRAAAFAHLDILFDSLKADRRSRILRNTVEEMLSRDVGTLRGRGAPIHPVKELLDTLRKGGACEDEIRELRKKIYEYFLSFRPSSFSKRIILKTARGEIETEYDVLRALLRFKPCIKDDRLIFLSSDRGLRRADIYLRVEGPLTRGEVDVSYKEFTDYCNKFQIAKLGWRGNIESIPQDAVELLKKYFMRLNIRRSHVDRIISNFLPFLSPLRVKIKDVLVPASEVIC